MRDAIAGMSIAGYEKHIGPLLRIGDPPSNGSSRPIGRPTIYCICVPSCITTPSPNNCFSRARMICRLDCARLIVHCHLAMLDAAYLLDKMGYYFAHRGRYEEADGCYKQALLICEQEQKPGESNVAASLDGVADSYRAKGRHEDADDLKQRALRIREQKLGPEHPHFVVVLRNYIVVL